MHDETATEAQSPQQATSEISDVLERAAGHLTGNNRRMSTIRERLQGATPQPELPSTDESKNENGMLSIIHSKALDLCKLLDVQAEIITDLERA